MNYFILNLVDFKQLQTSIIYLNGRIGFLTLFSLERAFLILECYRIKTLKFNNQNHFKQCSYLRKMKHLIYSITHLQDIYLYL